MVAIPTIVFLGILALVVFPYALFVERPEGAERRSLKKRIHAAAKRRRPGAPIVKQEEHLSSVAAFDALLARTSAVVNPIQRLIEQSGSSITVGTFVTVTVAAAIVPIVVSLLFSGRLIPGLVVGAIASMVPTLWLRHARTRRLWKFEEQFPEGIDLISRALKAGHAFPTGLSMVAEEMQAPIGTEFRQIYEHQNYGMPMSEALRAFGERTPLLDAKFFVTGVLTQREAGGNLAEVLDNLSEVIRTRFKVKRQVRAISAHGRITGWILSGLPPTLALVFAVVAPQHIETLYQDPLGQRMIVVALVLQIIGSLLVRKIVNIEY